MFTNHMFYYFKSMYFFDYFYNVDCYEILVTPVPNYSIFLKCNRYQKRAGGFTEVKIALKMPKWILQWPIKEILKTKLEKCTTTSLPKRSIYTCNKSVTRFTMSVIITFYMYHRKTESKLCWNAFTPLGKLIDTDSASKWWQWLRANHHEGADELV